jgi:hypothetical protein
MARNFYILVIFLPLWLSIPAIEVSGQQASGAAACTANPLDRCALLWGRRERRQ